MKNTITKESPVHAGNGPSSHSAQACSPQLARSHQRFIGGVAIAALTTLLWGCGGGSGRAFSEGTPGPEVSKYTIKAAVSGLLGDKITLLNNGVDELGVTADGEHSFKTTVEANKPYAVTVKTQASDFRRCVVENGSGTASADTTIKVTCGPAGVVSTLPVTGFKQPEGMVISDDGKLLYVADFDNGALKKIDLADNQASISSNLNSNEKLAAIALKNGNFYYALNESHQIMLGQTVLADSAKHGVNQPSDVAVDSADTVYVANSGGAAGKKILKISSAGVVTPLSLGSITATYPQGIALDEKNKVLYIANSADHNIIKYDLNSNAASIFAGSTKGETNGKGSADGNGLSATFNYPKKITFDALTGALYVVDAGGHIVRKIDKDGNVSTIAGTGKSGSADGKSTEAQFNGPSGVAFDSKNKVLYVSDGSNNKIRKISQAVD